MFQFLLCDCSQTAGARGRGWVDVGESGRVPEDLAALSQDGGERLHAGDPTVVVQ